MIDARDSYVSVAARIKCNGAAAHANCRRGKGMGSGIRDGRRETNSQDAYARSESGAGIVARDAQRAASGRRRNDIGSSRNGFSVTGCSCDRRGSKRCRQRTCHVLRIANATRHNENNRQKNGHEHALQSTNDSHKRVSVCPCGHMRRGTSMPIRSSAFLSVSRTRSTTRI